MKEKELLKTLSHIALATVNEDGTPHNTPLFFAVDKNFTRIYFASKEESVHTKNFVRTGRAFVVMYNSNTFQGGVYLTVEKGRKSEGEELEEGLKTYNEKCAETMNDALPPAFHLIEDGYRLYAGNITKIEVYHSVEDENGQIKRESRREIPAEEIIGR